MAHLVITTNRPRSLNLPLRAEGMARVLSKLGFETASEWILTNASPGEATACSLSGGDVGRSRDGTCPYSGQGWG